MRSNLGVVGLAVLLGGCTSTGGGIYVNDFGMGGAPAMGGAAGTSGAGGAGGSGGVGAAAGSGGAAGVDAGVEAGADVVTLPDGAPAGAGMGQACSQTVPCRAGLTCGASLKCEAGHSLTAGAACVTSAECKSGLYCGPLKQCAAIGAGAAGASCTSDGNCADGLRCSFVGLALECAAAGSADIGGGCTSSSDCLGGLVCASGACASIPGGLPAAPPSWQGATCEIETGNPLAWFSVPRGTGDKDFYRLPFPNDIRKKNGHPDLTGHPTPGADPLGYDIVDRYLRAIEQDNDGFGAYPTVFFRFNQDVDFKTWTGDAIRWIDVTQGALEFGWGLARSWGFNPNAGKYICARSLAIRPAQGEPLIAGHTYAVILTSVGKANGGGAIAASDDFKAVMKTTAPTADAALIAAHAAYQPLRAYAALLESQVPEGGAPPANWLDPSTFINAAVFTVGKVTDRAKNVAAAANGATLPPPIAWSKCGGDAGSAPCAAACGAPDPSFDELHAVIPVPIFQKGTPPYLDPKDGGDIAAATSAPTVVRTENVCAALSVPKGVAMPAAGWPLAIFAHGTGGDFQSHVKDGVAKALAGATGAPIAVLGIDQVEHGSRRGASTRSPNDLFFNFSNPRAARDNALQGAADQLTLARVAAAINVSVGASPTGAAIKFNPSAMLFWGHSQGATEGAIGLPFSVASAPAVDGGVPDGGAPTPTGVRAVVLSGAGASLMDSLLTKTSPTNIAAALPYVLQDADPGNPAALSGGLNNPTLNLLQTFFDPVDPLNFAAAMTAKPLAGQVPRHLFQVYGTGDTYSTPVTQATYALAAKIWVVAHDPSVTTADKIGLLVETPSPVSANLVTGSFTGAVREYAPATGDDGHFVAFKNANAKADVVRFLGQAALGQTPKVGP